MRVSPAQQPMARVCTHLETLGIDLGSCRALEFFAREGDWHTTVYASKVARLDAWEIDAGFEEALRRNLPGAYIRIGDSFALAERPEFAGTFDLVVYDNPQKFFGRDDRYCEHFEAIDTLRNLMRPQGIVILNVNMAPFDYDAAVRWQKRRNEFYQVEDTVKLEEKFVLDFYRRHFRSQRMTTCHAFIEPRYNSPIQYFTAVLEKDAAGAKSMKVA